MKLKNGIAPGVPMWLVPPLWHQPSPTLVTRRADEMWYCRRSMAFPHGAENFRICSLMPLMGIEATCVVVQGAEGGVSIEQGAHQQGGAPSAFYFSHCLVRS